MVGDAESHAEDDRRLRELAEARNNAENAAYQAERQLKDLGDTVDAASRRRSRRRSRRCVTVLGSEDAAEINRRTEALQTSFHKVSEAMYQRAQEQAAQEEPSSDGAGALVERRRGRGCRRCRGCGRGSMSAERPVERSARRGRRTGPRTAIGPTRRADARGRSRHARHGRTRSRGVCRGRRRRPARRPRAAELHGRGGRGGVPAAMRPAARGRGS